MALIVAAYGDDDHTTHLNNAMPDLFTFLRYPGLPSTNNATERDIWDTVVIQRRFRHKFASTVGIWVFSMLHGSISTCSKMHVVPMHMFERVVTTPGFDVISYGLSVPNPKALPAPPGYGAGVESGSGRPDCPPEPDTGGMCGAETEQHTGTQLDGTESGDDTDVVARSPLATNGAEVVVCILSACLQDGNTIQADRPWYIGGLVTHDTASDKYLPCP